MLKDNLLRARKKKGWTQQMLADATGIAQTVIARYENGATPNGKNLKLLSDHLGISIQDLLTTEKSQSIDTFDQVEFEKRLKRARSLPIKRQRIINDILGMMLDLQSVQKVADEIGLQ